MNSKNIKKSLNAKFNKWVDSISDKKIQDVVRDNTIISGRALVSLLTGTEVNDYDVYFKTKEAVLAVAQHYVDQFNSTHKSEATINDENGRIKIFIRSKGVAGDDPEEAAEDEEVILEDVSADEKPHYRPVYLTSNAITLSDKIQIVIRFWGDIKEIHTNYDFAHCTCSWSSWDNELILPQKALECIINKELYYIGSKYPVCSIIRSRKFIERGYTINAGQYLKMCLQVSELDLHNVEVLKDQLVGVDSAYFNTAISFMEKRQEDEPNWQPDDSYLFDIINKIF